MKNNKYTLLENDTIEVNGLKLYRIKAKKSFGNVTKGDLGGFIENDSNLSVSLRSLHHAIKFIGAYLKQREK